MCGYWLHCSAVVNVDMKNGCWWWWWCIFKSTTPTTTAPKLISYECRSSTTNCKSFAKHFKTFIHRWEQYSAMDNVVSFTLNEITSNLLGTWNETIFHNTLADKNSPNGIDLTSIQDFPFLVWHFHLLMVLLASSCNGHTCLQYISMLLQMNPANYSPLQFSGRQ